MKTPVCIEDLRVRARRKVPKAFYDYAESGSYNEKTLRSNCADRQHQAASAGDGRRHFISPAAGSVPVDFTCAAEAGRSSRQLVRSCAA